MAENDFRHAARRETYEVREGLHVLGVDLGLRHTCDDYLEAVDFAIEFLQEFDPDENGAVSALEIVRVNEEKRETVWRYRYDRSQRGHQDSMEIWGFDVSRWRGPETSAA